MKKSSPKPQPRIKENSISDSKGNAMSNPPVKSRLRRVRSQRNSVCISAALEDLDWKRWGQGENFGSYCLQVPDKAEGHFTVSTAAMPSDPESLSDAEAFVGCLRDAARYFGRKRLTHTRILQSRAAAAVDPFLARGQLGLPETPR
jgi:hypothetical protein